jgi:hypothetical protein
MSEEHVDLVRRDTAREMPQATRHELNYRDRPRRSLDERLFARFPRLGWRLSGRILRRPPSSGLRRRFLALIARRGYAALNRRDIDLNERVLYDAESELVLRGDFPLGTGPFRGAKAIADAYREWLTAWSEQKLIPRELIDLGNKVVVVTDENATGAGSGISVTLRRSEVVSLRDGHIDRHELFQNWEEGLRAAGVSDQALSPVQAGPLG